MVNELHSHRCRANRPVWVITVSAGRELLSYAAQDFSTQVPECANSRNLAGFGSLARFCGGGIINNR